uniref:Transmembrane protein 235 n=1 Tax=Takifugu rubripes TaxID=31033 RepID=A0A674P461_TAKRU
ESLLLTLYGVAILSAGFTGLLSFSLLAVAIGSDFWYIINVNNHTGPDDLSSHSGLWRIIEAAVICFMAAQIEDPSTSNLLLPTVVVIMLPLSLVLLVFGWIFGFVSSLVRIPRMLVGSASYILFCLFTLTGLLVYIQYCNQAMEDFKQVVSLENLTTVDVSFGWSFAIAWLSYSLEVTSSLLLMLAARITQMKHCYDSGMAML